MLVKLGSSWFDPKNVDSVGVNKRPDGFEVIVRTALSVGDDVFPTEEEANQVCDEYAAIINAALVTQSFGGETDEEAPQVA